jgi:pyruvate-formate lyase
VNAEGEDLSNELSGMFLDMVAHTRLGNPWTAARIHDNTPAWFAKKVAKAMRMGTDIMDDVHRELKPLPYLSLLIAGCTEQGRDVNTGAAPYNFTGPQAAGVGTVADSLAVIKQLVFEEQKISARELQDALKADWEGYDVLYHLVNSDKVHQYGNDDDYADELAIYCTDVYCGACPTAPCSTCASPPPACPERPASIT